SGDLLSRKIDFEANALGFAGSGKVGPGMLGISIAYVWTSLNVVDTPVAGPQKITNDTAEGFRLNLGYNYVYGPTTWGAVIQNAPGIVWGNEYKREVLPFQARVGNTWRIASGFILMADYERRFYNEGGDKQSVYHVGSALPITKFFVLRAG